MPVGEGQQKFNWETMNERNSNLQSQYPVTQNRGVTILDPPSNDFIQKEIDLQRASQNFNLAQAKQDIYQPPPQQVRLESFQPQPQQVRLESFQAAQPQVRQEFLQAAQPQVKYVVQTPAYEYFNQAPPIIDERLLQPLPSLQSNFNMDEFKNTLGNLQTLEFEDEQRMKEVLGGLGALNMNIGVPDSLNQIVNYCSVLRQENERLAPLNQDLCARNTALIDFYNQLQTSFYLLKAENEQLRQEVKIVPQLIKQNNDLIVENEELKQFNQKLQSSNRYLQNLCNNYVEMQESLTQQKYDFENYKKVVLDAIHNTPVTTTDCLSDKILDLIRAGAQGSGTQTYLEGYHAIDLGLQILKLKSDGYTEKHAELAQVEFKANQIALIQDSKYFVQKSQNGGVFYILEGQNIGKWVQECVVPFREVNTTKTV